MFKTAVLFGRFSKTSQNNIRNSLHEFSIAEFSSAIEMLHAAKRRDIADPKMAIGFLNHALDEYKHTGMFRDIISLLDKSAPTLTSNNKFSPLLAINKGYINPDDFLYDKMALDRFSVFIGVNEKSAHKLFTKLAKRLENTKSIELSASDINTIRNAFELILQDESRHSQMAFTFSERNISSTKLKLFLFSEKLNSMVRTFYASQGAISRAAATFIYTVVIGFIYPMKFVITMPENDSLDLLNPKRENLMI